MPHKYKLLYKIEKPEGGIEKKDVPEGYGATDAMLLVSILYPEDGSLSTAFVPVDGRQAGALEDESSILSDTELFKTWSMLTKRLADSSTLTEGKRLFCEQVFETFREIMLKVQREKAEDMTAAEAMKVRPDGN
jgi:hypothetical protein